MKKLSGGRIPHRKSTVGMSPETLPTPKSVTIPMSMHVGAPAKILVKVGDGVKVGQKIGETDGFISAPIHASVSGKVTKITEVLMPSGKKSPAVVVETDGLQESSPELCPHPVETFAQFIEAVRESGAVGLGGAGFPTAVKLGVKNSAEVEEIIINGAECEPYITSDTITMTDNTESVAQGAELLLQFFPNSRVLMGIEKNNPLAIKALSDRCTGNPAIRVCSLPSLYPQGGEKVMIFNLTGKIVPEGKFPVDVGTIVINCTTLAKIMEYIKTGMPLVSKCVTVDGSAVKRPANVIVPIGTPIAEVLTFCDTSVDDVKKIIMGGPMMGIAVRDSSAPVLKNNNAILAFAETDTAPAKETECIRCGRCVKVCPLNLMPFQMELAHSLEKPESLERLKVNLCMECGICAYSCPAARPLVQKIKLGKLMLRSYQDKKREQEVAK